MATLSGLRGAQASRIFCMEALSGGAGDFLGAAADAGAKFSIVRHTRRMKDRFIERSSKFARNSRTSAAKEQSIKGRAVRGHKRPCTGGLGLQVRPGESSGSRWTRRRR